VTGSLAEEAPGADERVAVGVEAALARRRVLVLLSHDPPTGAATAPAGVIGLEGDSVELSWVPYAEAAERWRSRVVGTTVVLHEAIDAWLELADGISWDVVELEPAGSPDLRGDVEIALDELLATGD
jgi:hypothetical protein